MALVRTGKAVRIRLRKDLVRDIKRGHCWLFSDAIDLIQAPEGSVALLTDRPGESLASGIYAPDHAIPLRICRTQPPMTLDDAWCRQRIEAAFVLRAGFFDSQTTGYRLVAGEGDQLPGLVIDRYGDTAVIKLDGGGPESFYLTEGIADFVSQLTGVRRVVLRSRQRGSQGQVLIGPAVDGPIAFLENGIQFTADVLLGQKTGFFLDQRDNRELIRKLSRGRRVLNLFSFSGGFSVAAGLGGAAEVHSIDIAKPAILAAQSHWECNGLPTNRHTGVTEDAFEFLETAIANREAWDIVICDPPSFAPNESSRQSALQAYSRLAQLAVRVTAKEGLLAVASCSSHIDRATFLRENDDALRKARRKAILLSDRGLPIDHPTPLAMPELRYLKFLLFKVD